MTACSTSRRAWAVRICQTLVAITLPLAGASARPQAPPDPVTRVADAEASANDAPFEGRVAAYLLSPDAGVAGLIFDDGRQVAVPPHLGVRLAALVQPGQQVRVGARRNDVTGPGGFRSITALATGLSLTAAPEAERPLPRAAGDPIAALQPVRVAGAIRLRLRGPRGETNGLLLDTGTQVFFPPHVADEAGAGLRPGETVGVEGYGRTSGYGTVLQATSIAGPNGLAITVYRPPRPRPKPP